MKILICPDKFKGSLSANEVCRAIGNGLQEHHPAIKAHFHPMADGGDGSLEVLAAHLNLAVQNMLTTDPLGREIAVRYFTSPQAAFIELASASGLVLLAEDERNPYLTTTFGTGKMIADAIVKGYQHIYLFLGGSATNDAGMGIAAALGWEFLDREKRVLEPTGGNLSAVRFIKNNSRFDLTKIKFTLLCDVTNPLYGPNGAAYVYARQKGASEEQIAYLDNGLKHFSKILQKQLGKELSTLPGSGAAGGIGAGLTALVGAKLESGFASISELTGLEKQIQSADYIISGEGKLDLQSLQGKVVDGVAKLCQKHGKPLILFVGKNDLSAETARSLGASQILAIAENAKNIEDAILNGASYLRMMTIEFQKSLEG